MGNILSTPSTDQLSGLTPDQNLEWRRSGKLPEAKTEDSPSSPAPKQAEAEGEKPKAAESETAPKPDEKETIETRKAKTARRFEELLAENRELRKQLEERSHPKANGEQHAVAPAEKPADKDEAPKPEAFSTYEEFLDARSEWKARQVLKDYEAKQKEAAEKAKADEEGKKIRESWEKRVAEAAKKHEDFYELVLNDPTLPIKAGSVPHGFILESDQGAEVAYYLATHREELDRINSLNPYAQGRELYRIEASLTSPDPPAKKVTEAPPPAKELGSGATPPKDELEDAVAKGDTARYLREANQRDLQRRKRG